MKLSEAALGAALGEPDEPDGEDLGGEAVFDDAAAEAFAAAKSGDQAAFSAALKGAIEACVADYMGSDEE